MIAIETKNLELICFTQKHIRSLIQDRTKFVNLMDADVPDDWPNDAYNEVLPYVLEELEEDPQARNWNFMIVEKASNTLIGEIGGKGQPDEKGALEVGYGIVEDFRNRGFATEALKALSEWLLQQPEVEKLTAECLEENVASMRVLSKSGYVITGTRESDEGKLLLWRYNANLLQP